MFRTIILFFALIAVASTFYTVNININLNDGCNCIPINYCTTAFENLAKLKASTSQKRSEYIQSISCGYIGSVQKVCCPSSQIDEKLSNIWGWYLGRYVSWANQLVSAQINHNGIQSGININIQKITPTYNECGRVLNRKTYISNATELTDFPWLALLEYNTPHGKKFLCGGSLISDQYVLTAARCVTSPTNKLISVRLGEYDTTTNVDCTMNSQTKSRLCVNSLVNVPVDSYLVHEGYNEVAELREDLDSEPPNQNDIALVRLKKKVSLNTYVQPICLPSQEPRAKKFLVAGWSRSMIPGRESRGLNRKTMALLKDLGQTCVKSNRVSFAGEEHICVGEDPSVHDRPCVSDGGGPLMGYETRSDGITRMTLYGVSALDLSCSDNVYPYGLFTRIYEHVPWIKEKLRKF